VNDLSMLSRAERGALPVDIGQIDVPSLLEELVHNYKGQAEEKGLKLESSIALESTVSLTSSKLYIREVLQNFITNAIKYTEQGSVTISVKAIADGMEFAVHDTGIGISRNDQQRVFEKFFRSGDYRTTKASGTGLGLYVTAKLARMLRAQITMHSILNQGSTFAVEVPNLGMTGEKKSHA
jgi:signal transduction histidine kinase